MALAVERPATNGVVSGPPVMLLHGFTQNARCWGLLGTELCSHRDVIAVDLPGHGLSHHDDADLDRAAALVAEVIEGLDEPPLVIGYSMGGRVALHVALAHPDAVSALVLIGATGGLDGDAERQQRRDADAALAERLLEDGLDMFLDQWLALPLFADLDDLAAAREQRLTNRVEGLAASLRHCGTGRQRPLWPDLHTVSIPTLCIAGGHDDKFIGLGQRLVTSIGSNAELVTIDGAGHACHLSAPAATLDAISAAGFLGRATTD